MSKTKKEINLPEPVFDRLVSLFATEATIERVYLFGSRARGDHQYNSDIDLAIEGINIPPTFNLAIKEAAGLYKVDTIDLSEVDQDAFLEEIHEDSVLLYERESH